MNSRTLGFLTFALPLIACAPLVTGCTQSADLASAGGSSYMEPGVNGDTGSANAGSAPPGTTTPEGAVGELVDNDFVDTAVENTSTFGIDVDTGSYSLTRRAIQEKTLPAPTSVRPEEFSNYFRYDYPQPDGDRPFSVQIDGAPSTFGEGLHLLRVGLQGKKIQDAARKRANLVFLVDQSGSMQSSDKLGLVQYSLKQLTKRLEPTDTLSIVTYAGTESVLLAPTPVTDKSAVLDAIDRLTAGGGTNGEGGIRKAYALAESVKDPEGINRVVLCTDGDFNVGLTGDALVKLIEQERDSGVTLTTLGFGTGNYQDGQMEALADHGNGNYAYIDSQGEANRVLGENLVSTLQVIAKDVKVQVEFAKDAVSRYRLVGYENRVLANDDFQDDTKDAGELGAGHSVTAFYEIELTAAAKSASLVASPLATVRLRYKAPDGDVSTEFSKAVNVGQLAATFDAASPDFRFAAGVAEFAEILRHSKHSTGARFDDVLGIAAAATGGQADRAEFVTLVPGAKPLYR